MVLDFLRLNPQLKRLHVESDSSWIHLNTNLIRSAVDSLLLSIIETLYLDINPYIDNGDFIHMKSVKFFGISFDHLNYLPLHFLPFSFEHLNKFSIHFPKVEFYGYLPEQFF